MISLIGKVQFEGREYFVTPQVEDNNKLSLLNGNFQTGFSLGEKSLSIDTVEFKIPFTPGKIYGIGKNYPSEGAIENPISFFLMADNALLPNKSSLVLSKRIGSVIPEGELGVVISKTIKNITPEEALDSILGYTICNDFSARDTDPAEIPAAAKKSSDGFLPVGPFLFLKSQIQSFSIKTYKNNMLVQSGNTSNMLNKIPELISYISSFITLNKFDLISTGTPGPKVLAYRGDKIKVEIEGIGILETEII